MYRLVQWWRHFIMVSYQHVVTGSKQTNQTMNWMIAYYLCVCYQWGKYGISVANFAQHFFTVLWFSKTKITDGTGILALVRVMWDMISKIYWQFLHSFFKNTLERKQLQFLSHWNSLEQNGTFSLFDTSVNGNLTFAYIMAFPCTSVYTSWGRFIEFSTGKY